MTDKPNNSEWEPIWEAPPEVVRKGRSVWLTRLQALVSNQGEWAKIAEYESKGSAHNLRTHLKSRRYRIPKPKDNWEFTVRDGSVYAKYNGPEEDSDTRAGAE